MKRAVIREALAHCETWLNGAVILMNGQAYAAYPAAYMSDISFTGGGDEVYKIDRLADVTGDERKWGDLAADEQEWAIDQVEAAWGRCNSEGAFCGQEETARVLRVFPDKVTNCPRLTGT